jgi:S1-C subfamily serine protease
MTRPRPVSAAAVAVLAVMTLAACTNNPAAAPTSSTTATATGQSSPPSNAPELEKNYVSVVAQVLPSVVQITTGSGLGSGVILDDKGDIVTNAHVVGTATTFQVRLANNPTTFPATLVGAYPPDDLAVIHLDQPPTGLKPARFGDSSKLQIGDIVLAMGNPLGLTGSVTDGIVSAVGRAVTEPAGDGSPGATLPQVIQTSAAINPGNSGGALVDLSADVIGVPTLAAISPQTGGSAAPGIGFAIPSNVVTDIAGQLVANGGHVPNSRRAALGIGAVTVVDQNGQPAGVAVGSVVPGGPAAAAGIKPGDVITAVNNTPVQSSAELSEVLAGLSPGQAVPVTVVDPQGKTTSVTVTLGQLPGS